jgi:hypothetical protein
MEPTRPREFVALLVLLLFLAAGLFGLAGSPEKPAAGGAAAGFAVAGGLVVLAAVLLQGVQDARRKPRE